MPTYTLEVDYWNSPDSMPGADTYGIGIDGLFSIDIDGDVGKDPNFMTLWFSQPSLGLPAKVGSCRPHVVGMLMHLTGIL